MPVENNSSSRGAGFNDFVDRGEGIRLDLPGLQGLISNGRQTSITGLISDWLQNWFMNRGGEASDSDDGSQDASGPVAGATSVGGAELGLRAMRDGRGSSIYTEDVSGAEALQDILRQLDPNARVYVVGSDTWGSGSLMQLDFNAAGRAAAAEALRNINAALASGQLSPQDAAARRALQSLLQAAQPGTNQKIIRNQNLNLESSDFNADYYFKNKRIHGFLDWTPGVIGQSANVILYLRDGDYGSAAFAALPMGKLLKGGGKLALAGARKMGSAAFGKAVKPSAKRLAMKAVPPPTKMSGAFQQGYPGFAERGLGKLGNREFGVHGEIGSNVWIFQRLANATRRVAFN